MAIDWFDNDELFRKELATGQFWTGRVVEALNARGVDCYCINLPLIRGKFPDEDRKRFENEKDILLADGRSVEVKSRNFWFTEEPSSYPYETAFVDTLAGWEKKHPIPLAVVLVSQKTGSMLSVPVSTRQTWRVVNSFDRVRQIPESSLAIDRSLLRTFDELVRWLLDRQERLK